MRPLVRPLLAFPRRELSTSLARPRRDDPYSRPSPPPLPPSEQKEFDRLVKSANAPLSSDSLTAMTPEARRRLLDSFQQAKRDEAKEGEEEVEMHPDVRTKPRPDFEGEENPNTGEVGGPKKDPLTWEREWTYGGRATDF